MKIRLATSFSGIGAIEFALHRLGVETEQIFACDNGERIIDYDPVKEFKIVSGLPTIDAKKKYVDDLYAQKTRHHNFVKDSYLANYPLPEGRFYEDIRLLDGRDYRGAVDLYVGGSPCQSFSTVGFQAGLEDTRGTLFYDYARTIKEIQPKVFIYENVRGLLTHDDGKTWSIIRSVFESLGYKCFFSLLNAEDYGVPQIRRRLYLVGFKDSVDFHMPKPVKLKLTMQDFLIENTDFGGFCFSKTGSLSFSRKSGTIDPKYFLTPKLYAYVMKPGTKTFYTPVVIDRTIARTVLSTMGNRHRAGVDNYVTVNGKVRMLSEREAHRLMGFTDDYKIVVSRAQAYKQAGNSIVVDVLMAILKEIFSTGVFGD